MSYILGTKLVSNKQVRLALTQIFGIGPKKATWICDQLGLSDNTKVSNLTRHQINQISKIVRRKKILIDSELKREIQRYIKRLININCYRGFRHKAGLPLRGQQTHNNAKTCRRLRKISTDNQRKNKNNSRGRQDAKKKNETEKMEIKNTIMQKQPFKHQRQQLRRQQRRGKHHQKLRKHHGIAHIQSSFSNTFITITNCKGDEIKGSSSGCLREFRGSRRSDKYAAQATAERVAQAATQLEIRSVEVKIKGIGLVRKGFLLKGLKEGGLIITRIRDVTPVPHNGCRPPKKRRV